MGAEKSRVRRFKQQQTNDRTFSCHPPEGTDAHSVQVNRFENFFPNYRLSSDCRWLTNRAHALDDEGDEERVAVPAIGDTEDGMYSFQRLVLKCATLRKVDIETRMLFSRSVAAGMDMHGYNNRGVATTVIPLQSSNSDAVLFNVAHHYVQFWGWKIQWQLQWSDEEAQCALLLLFVLGQHALDVYLRRAIVELAVPPTRHTFRNIGSPSSPGESGWSLAERRYLSGLDAKTVNSMLPSGPLLAWLGNTLQAEEDTRLAV